MNSKEKRLSGWDYFTAFFDGTLAELWFRVAEWLLVVAAFSAIGVASGSLAVKIIAHVSAGLVILHALHLGDLAIARVRTDIQGVKLLTRIVMAVAVISGQYALVTAVNAAVRAALSTTVSTP